VFSIVIFRELNKFVGKYLSGAIFPAEVLITLTL